MPDSATLKATAHVDSFARDNLPPREQWPEIDLTGVPELAAYPEWLNCAAELLDRQAEVHADPGLGALVDQLLVKSALGAILMARKAGQFVTGAAKCDAAVRSGQAVAVLHAHEAAPDGVRKLDQARRAVEYMDGPVIPAFKLFPEAELGLAIGGANVIHAAVLDGQAGRAAVRRIVALQEYREGPGNETDAAQAAKDDR